MQNFHKYNAIQLIYILLILLLSYWFVTPFLISIVLGGTMAMTLFPMLIKVEKWGLKRKPAAFAVTSAFTFLLSIPFFFFVAKGTLAVTEHLEEFSSDEKYRNKGVQNILAILKHDVVDAIKLVGKKLHVDFYLTDVRVESFLVKTNKFFLNFFQEFAMTLPTIFLLFLVMVLCVYSFLIHSAAVRDFFQKLIGLNDARMDQIVNIFMRNSSQVYISNIVTGGIQSLMVSLAVAIMGLGDFFLVFFVTLILSFVPVVGAAPVAFVFSLYAFFIGKTSLAVILIVLGSLTGLVDNILRPFLASMGESKTPAVVSFIFVIGGALTLGFPGLFLGLLVGSIAYDTLPIFWEELTKKEN